MQASSVCSALALRSVHVLRVVAELKVRWIESVGMQLVSVVEGRLAVFPTVSVHVLTAYCLTACLYVVLLLLVMVLTA